LQKAFAGQLEVFCDFLFCRIIDAFEIFLSDLLISAFKSDPKLFEGSEKKLEFAEIAEFKARNESLEDLIESMAEKTALDFAYANWKKRRAQYASKLRLGSFLNDEGFKDLVIMSADRNITGAY